MYDQKNNPFKLRTYFSELTCVECDFWVYSDIKKGDRFYKIRGEAAITNLASDEKFMLKLDSVSVCCLLFV